MSPEEAVMKTKPSVSAMVFLTFSSAILLLMVSAIVAQNRNYGDRKANEEDAKRSGIHASATTRGGVRATHIGLSPFPTPTPTDSRFIVDTGYAGLDTTCTYRSEGSLKFKIAVKRVVGDVNSDGTLVDPQKLKNNGVISEFATLQMPARDIDFDTEPSPPYNPERDRLLFNGVPIGNLEGDAYLRGLNERWILNEFKIPINLVRFGRKGLNGTEPAPGENEIEILIDQANIESGEDLWCTSVDWASLSFQALSPVVLINGNGTCGAFFEGDYKCNGQLIGTSFVAPFISQGIPYDNSINLGDTKLIQENSDILSTEIPRIATEFGVKWVHLVAHSKGGLDARDFLAGLDTEGDLGILSLTTLSTPHHGSVGADLSVGAAETNFVGIPFSDQPLRTLVAAVFQRPNRGRHNLTTKFIEETFNPANEPALPDSFRIDGEKRSTSYFSFGADANLDFSEENNNPRKPTIQQDEVIGMPRGPTIMQFVYRFLGNNVSARVTKTLRILKTVDITESAQFEKNDFAVTRTSSKYEPRFQSQGNRLDNHATIVSTAVANLVIPLIKASQGN
jgi:hypothetical protein